MTKVVIIGGGFAGLSAARALGKARGRVECTLVDRRGTFDYLPMLPDILSRRVDPELLQYDLRDFGRKFGFTFLHAEVTGIDLEGKSVTLRTEAPPENKAEGLRPKAEGRDDTPAESSFGLRPSTLGLAYDYVIIASGAVTDFYGREDMRACAYVIDSVADARKVFDVAQRGDFRTALVVGGGYTGIEVATNLRRRFQKQGMHRRIMIVELADQLVGALDPWMSGYIESNLRAMDVDFALNATVREFRGRDAVLSDGRVVPDVLLIWSAGVCTGDLVKRLPVPHGRQGRLVADEYLRLSDSCYVAGDAAFVMNGDRPMRMAIQVALDEGDAAGRNVANAVLGRQLRRYRPLDLGWLVPMANGRSCGKALGVSVRGWAATLLHYVMCLLRAPGLLRRLRIASQLLLRR